PAKSRMFVACHSTMPAARARAGMDEFSAAPGNSEKSSGKVVRMSKRRRDTLLSVGRVEEEWKPCGEHRREPIDPRRIDEADTNQVAKMCAVLVAVGNELHSDERFQRNDPEIHRVLRLGELGETHCIIAVHPLTRVENVDAFARLSIHSI